MITHDLVTARISLLNTLTDTSHLLRVSKLHRAAGHDDAADEYVHKALSRLERAHEAHTKSATHGGGYMPCNQSEVELKRP